MSGSHLFLHYGPGGNADVERAWFKNSSSSIEFWDQPIINVEKDAYGALLTECKNKIDEKFRTNSGVPLKVLAHSFGCNMALDLAAQESGKISSLALLAPLSDLAQGFFNFGSKLLLDSKTSEEVKKGLEPALRAFEKAKGADRVGSFWGVVGEIVKDPDFNRLYWASEKARAKYTEQAKNTRPLDFPMWQKVIQDYLTRSQSKWTLPAGCSVDIVLGARDPYITLPAEKSFWQKCFPRSSVRVLENVGHYIQFEEPALVLGVK